MISLGYKIFFYTSIITSVPPDFPNAWADKHK